MDNAQWFVAKNRTKHGPYSTAQLRQMAAAGTLQPADMVLAHGAAKWQPASAVPGLFPPPPLAVSADAPPLPPELAQADYFVTVGGQRQGPFTLAQIPAQGLRPETPVWKRGTAQWVRADQMPEVNALFTGAVPSAPAPAGATGGRPWNPVAVAWLGLLFSPVWCGVMAAVNVRRLRLDTPWWRPVGVGVGSLIVFLVVNLWVDWYLLDLALYLGAVGLIAGLDLMPQKEPYLRYAGQGYAAGRWVGPSLAGIPLALLAFLALVVSPLLPLEPRQVCDRFLQATTEAEMKRYTTSNLWPALPTLTRLASKDSPDDAAGEFTEEGPAPPEVGGYLVGFRMVFREGGQPVQVDGLFHLLDRQGQWKIEDMYFIAVNRHPLEREISLARDYPALVNLPPERVATSGGSAPQGGQAPQATARRRPIPAHGIAYLLNKGGKGILAFLAALGAGVAAVWRKVTERRNGTAT
jgi:hypothetical protein